MKKLKLLTRKLCFSPVTKLPTNLPNKIKLGLKPSNSDLNNFLSFLFRSEKFNLSLNFFSQITSNSINPNGNLNRVVAEAVLKLHSGSENAENLILHMEKFGVKNQNGVLDLVVCNACMAKMDHDFGFNLFEDFVRNHGFVPSYETINKLVFSIGFKGDIETALKVFDLISKRSEIYPHWNYICKVLVIKFSEIGNPESGLRIYERIKKIDGFSSNVVPYSSLIQTLCKDSKFIEASDLLYEMEKEGIKLNIRTYNLVLNGLCKIEKTNKTNEISQRITGIKTRIKTLFFPTDINTCNLLIRVLFISSKVDDARELFVEMSHKGLIPNSVTFCLIINGFREIKETDNLLEVFEEHMENTCNDCINNERRIEMSFHVFKELLKGNLSSDLNKLSDFDQSSGKGAERVLNIVKEIEKLENGSSYHIICNHALVLLILLNCPNYALEIYLLLRKRSLRITSNTSYVLIKSLLENKFGKYTIRTLICEYIKLYPKFESKLVNLISQYSSIFNDINEVIIKLTKEGRIIEAMNLVHKNIQNGVSINLSSYSILIDKLCKVGYIEKALDLCENMKNSGTKPNIIIYNLILNGLCKEECLVEAFRLLKFIEENDLNLKPTIYTYAPLISVLCNEGLLDDAHKVFDRMLEREILPNMFVINLIIDGYCKLGLVENALMFLCSMIEKYFIQPDEFTVSSILEGYYYKGDVEGAFKYYKEYRNKNIFPDFLGFMCLVNGFYSKGRMEETREIIREMLNCTEIEAIVNKYGNEIYNESLVSLLLVACDKGRMKDVINILKEVGSMMSLKDPKEGFVDMKFDCDLKNCQDLKEKSLKDDFDDYYLIMKELCEKGEVNEANSLINTMILNSEVK